MIECVGGVSKHEGREIQEGKIDLVTLMYYNFFGRRH